MSENRIQQIAAKAVIVVRGKILILHPSAIDNNRNWHFPGGRRDSMNEEIENTAKREVLEETSIDLSLAHGKVIMVSEWVANNNNENVQIMGVFFCYDMDAEPKIKLSEEHDRFIWLNSSNISDLNVNKEVHEVLKVLGI